MRSLKILLISLTFGLLLITWGAIGEVYRWVDDQGEVHYSDVPPAAQDYGEVAVEDVPAPPAQEQRQQKDRWQRIIQQQQESRARRLKKAEEERVAREAKRQEEAVRAERCRLARHNLNTLLLRRPVYHLNEQGERAYVDDRQRAAEIRRARKEIEDFCD